MLDIGWNELLIIALVTILVVGPKELPHVLRTVTQFFRKLRAMAAEFQSGLDDLAREAELQDLKQTIEKTASTDLAGELEQEFDPTGEINRSVRELEQQVAEDPRKGGKPSAPTETSAATTAPSSGDSAAPMKTSSGSARKTATKKKKAG